MIEDEAKLVITLKWVEAYRNDLDKEADDERGVAVLDTVICKLVAMNNQKMDLVEGKLDLYDPLSGKNSRKASDYIKLSKPINRNRRVHVFVEEKE